MRHHGVWRLRRRRVRSPRSRRQRSERIRPRRTECRYRVSEPRRGDGHDRVLPCTCRSGALSRNDHAGSATHALEVVPAERASAAQERVADPGRAGADSPRMLASRSRRYPAGPDFRGVLAAIEYDHERQPSPTSVVSEARRFAAAPSARRGGRVTCASCASCGGTCGVRRRSNYQRCPSEPASVRATMA